MLSLTGTKEPECSCSWPEVVSLAHSGHPSCLKLSLAVPNVDEIDIDHCEPFLGHRCAWLTVWKALDQTVNAKTVLFCFKTKHDMRKHVVLPCGYVIHTNLYNW